MPSTTNLQIAYNDYFEGYQESFAFDGHQVTRPCILSWADRANFKTAMLGWSREEGKEIVRFTPETHPEYDFLYAMEVNFHTGKGTPDEAGTGLITHKAGPTGGAGTGKVIADVIYRAVDYEISDQKGDSELTRYVSRYVTYSVENLQVTGGSYVWDVGEKTIQEPMTQIFITRTLRYVWHQVPAAPGIRLISTLESTINSTLGKVNQFTFDGRYAAGTLLFSGLDPHGTRTAEGQPALEIEYQFQERPSGWNNYLRWTGVDGPGFYAVKASGKRATDTGPLEPALDPADGTPRRPYLKADFDKLFRLA